MGVTLPPIGPSMRATWPALVSTPEDRAAAYALEAALQELPIVAGPLLVAACVAIASPDLALAASAGFGSIGALSFSRVAPVPIKGGSNRIHRPAEAAALRIRAILAVTVSSSAAGGAMEVALPAFAERHGGASLAGLLLGSVAIGSLLCGVWMTSRRTQRPPVAGYFGALAAAAVTAWLLLAPRTIVQMGLIAVLVGAPTAPTFASAYVLLSRATQLGQRTRTFGWMSASVMAGTSLGNLTAGWSIRGLGLGAALSLAGVYNTAALAIALLLLSDRR
jgi:hypothetical protein